jgi:hypothetical protein
VLTRDGSWVLDLVLACIMLAAVLLVTVYVGAATPSLTPQGAYAVYDGEEVAAARWFMPRRNDSSTAVRDAANKLAAARGSGGDASDALVDAAGLQMPGGPGRWLLPVEDGDMDALGALLSGVNRCLNAWSVYGLLQCIVLLLLVVQLLVIWSFQRRLGIVTSTLVASLPQLGHLCLIFVLCMALFAGLLTVALGARAAPVQSLGAAWYDMFLGILAGSELTLHVLYPAGYLQTGAERVLVTLAYYMREAMFAFVLINYVMATLGTTFLAVKKEASRRDREAKRSHGRTGDGGIPDDLTRIVWPELLAAAYARCRSMVTRGHSSGGGGGSTAAAAAAAGGGWWARLWGRVRGHRDTGSSAGVYEAEEVAEAGVSSHRDIRLRSNSLSRPSGRLSCSMVRPWLRDLMPTSLRYALAAKGHSGPTLVDKVPAVKVPVPVEPGEGSGSHHRRRRRGRDQLAMAALDLDAFQEVVLGVLGEEGQSMDRGAGAALMQQLEVLGRKQGRALQQVAAHESEGVERPRGWSEAAAQLAAGLKDAEAVAGAVVVTQAILRAAGVPVPEDVVLSAHTLLREQGLMRADLSGSDEAAAAGLQAEAEKMLEAGDDTLAVHLNLFESLWSAVTAMERWSVANAKWHTKVVKEMDVWHQHNQQLLLRHQLPGGYANRSVGGWSGTSGSTGGAPESPRRAPAAAMPNLQSMFRGLVGGKASSSAEAATGRSSAAQSGPSSSGSSAPRSPASQQLRSAAEALTATNRLRLLVGGAGNENYQSAPGTPTRGPHSPARAPAVLLQLGEAGSTSANALASGSSSMSAGAGEIRQQAAVQQGGWPSLTLSGGQDSRRGRSPSLREEGQGSPGGRFAGDASNNARQLSSNSPAPSESGSPSGSLRTTESHGSSSTRGSMAAAAAAAAVAAQGPARTASPSVRVRPNSGLGSRLNTVMLGGRVDKVDEVQQVLTVSDDEDN